MAIEKSFSICDKMKRFHYSTMTKIHQAPLTDGGKMVS